MGLGYTIIWLKEPSSGYRKFDVFFLILLKFYIWNSQTFESHLYGIFFGEEKILNVLNFCIHGIDIYKNIWQLTFLNHMFFTILEPYFF